MFHSKVTGFGVVLFLSVFCSSAIQAASQWHHIDGPIYELIFPADIETEAQRVAALLDAYLSAHQKVLPLKGALRKIPIVLYADDHTANGNVGVMPYRSRWYNRPATLGAMEWFTMLAVHEGRHVVQFNQILENPAGRLMHVLIGDAGPAGLLFAFVPSWYLEGDAVVGETALTKGGRGRVASFDLWFRTDLLNHPAYSYERAMLGTGFDRTPYHSIYVLGYFLVAQAELEFDEQVFDRTLDKIATGDSFSFNSAFKRQTKRSLSQHYQQTIAELETRWRQQQDQLTLTPVDVLFPAGQKHWRSVYPVASTSGSLTALIVDVEQGSSLVTVSSDQTASTLTPIAAQISRDYYSTPKTKRIYAYDDRFCWVAQHRHPTKLYVSYGELECWRANDGREVLTTHEKLTSALVVDDGFIAHRFTAKRESELVKLNSHGQEEAAWSLPSGSLATDFSYFQQQVVFVLSGSSQDGLYQLDRMTGKISRLIPSDQSTLRAPILTANWLIFTSDATGIDQLYAMSRHDRTRYRISTRPYGAYFPIWDANNARLVFSDYTANGQQLVQIPFADAVQPEKNWQVLESTMTRKPFIAPLIPAELPDTAIKKHYDVQRYSPLAHLWNPHTWWLSADNNGFTGSILSSDVLDKLTTIISAGFDGEGKTYHSSMSASYRLDAGPLLKSAIAGATDGSVTGLLAVTQPWQWQSGVWHRTLALSTGLEWEKDETSRVFGEGALSLLREGGLNTLASPANGAQTIRIDQDDDQQLRFLSTSHLLFSPNAHTALSAQSQAQYLEEGGDELVEPNVVFSDLNNDGWSARYQLNARWNPGAVGQSLGSAAFWRNTIYGLHFHGQDGNTDPEQAVGLSIAPQWNLFRNSKMVVSTELAYFYRLDNQSSRVAFSVLLAGE